MKILIANDGYADVGGVHSYMECVAAELIARGHDVRGLYYDVVDPGKVETILASMENFSVQGEGLEPALQRARRWKPDVCFSQNMRFVDIEQGLQSLAPTVKFMHGFNGVCISGQKMHGFPNATPCHRTFGPACLALYFPRRCGKLSWSDFSTGWQQHRALQTLFGQYRYVVVASEFMEAEYRRHGCTEAQLRCAPLFATEAERPETDCRKSAQPTLLFLGRMTNLKGGDVLIRAFAEAQKLLNSSLRLVMAGDGPARTAWEELAKSLDVQAEFSGWVAGAARSNLLAEAHLLAVPSIWPEPFGLVGLEAARNGTASIAFDLGGINQWLKDGVNGLLVRGERADWRILGRALADAFRDPRRLVALGQRAREESRSWTVQRHVSQLEELFKAASA